MYTVESKSMLARLMASENITVEHHSNAKTAKFDLKARRLICPLWKDMSGDLYDLLMGHEISHALHTPLEGWHDSIINAGGDVAATKPSQKSFRHFLNVLEDARIEKLIKRMYPGLRGPMARAYKDLLAKDFFGLHGRSNFNELYLIDKMNLSAKVGTLLNIKFTAKEQPFVEAMQTLETWEQVVELTKKLYAFSKVEQEEAQKEKKKKAQEDAKKQREEEQRQREEECESEPDENEDESSEGTEDESEDAEDDGDSDSEDSDEKPDDTEEDGKDATEEDEDEDETEENSDEEKSTDVTGDQESTVESEKEDFVPESSTDESFRHLEHKLIDKCEVRSLYLTIPTPNLKDCVTPASIVNRGLNDYYRGQRAQGKAMLAAFHKKNDDYIGLLAKEFEMKKAAKSYKNSRQAESGDIDISKLASYRTDDNIFKKLTVVYKGKSHGLVLLLDRSGSMESSVIGATEQILILASFCRKVNIPFVAYSFTDNRGCANEYDFGARAEFVKRFSQEDEEFATSEIAFRELLNSSMQPFEFSQSVVNQLQLADGLGKRRTHIRSTNRRGYTRHHYNFNTTNFPDHESLGSTPLNEALIILRDVIRQFKIRYHLDIVNVALVHDGDSNGNYSFHHEGLVVPTLRRARISRVPKTQNFDPAQDRVTILDKKEHLSFVCPSQPSGLQTALQMWIQATTGCGLFGFYILSTRPGYILEGLGKMYVNQLGIPLGSLTYQDDNTSDRRIMHNTLAQKLEDERFLESYIKGYTRFYFVPGGTHLQAENGELVNTSKSKSWTGRSLLTAFIKANKKQAVSRVLVSRFIDQIAVH